MDDVLFVINPLAAAGRADRVWERLAGQSRALRRAAVIRAADPLAATRQLTERLKPRIKKIIAIGGDGTVHHTANALLSLPGAGERALGLIPVGSGSDLARGLRMSHSPRLALTRALEDEPAAVDLLRLAGPQSTEYAVNVASAGLSVPVVNAVNSARTAGRWRYLKATLKALGREPPLRSRIYLDGTEWYEGDLLLLAMANGTRFGRGMRIAPRARIDDGLMDVVLVEAVPLWRLMPWLPTLYLGQHERAPFVRLARARSVRIEPAGTAALEADGEVAAALPAEVTIQPGAMRMLGVRASRR